VVYIDLPPEANAATGPAAPTRDAPVRCEIDLPAFVHDYSNERGRLHSRTPRAGDPSREYARRQKAARRRTNLARAEIT